MKIYSIFDDFDRLAADKLIGAGHELTVLPKGQSRPTGKALQEILEDYDCIIIGTGQKISVEMFSNITSPKIIATASTGVDHITVPEDKKHLITVLNTPGANAAAVAEYIIGAALNCCRRLAEGRLLYQESKDNKKLRAKPVELGEKTLGVIGAGSVSRELINLASAFHMNIICWTPHPERHPEIFEGKAKNLSLEELASRADIISLNMPDCSETHGLISSELIRKMKTDAIFISVSRLSLIDIAALTKKAKENPSFYVCLDLDPDPDLVNGISRLSNVYITPHIAGGTVESRIRMFRKAAERINSFANH